MVFFLQVFIKPIENYFQKFVALPQFFQHLVCCHYCQHMSVLEKKLFQIKILLPFQVNYHIALQEVLIKTSICITFCFTQTIVRFTIYWPCSLPEFTGQVVRQLVWNYSKKRTIISVNNFKTGSIDQRAKLPSFCCSNINLHWLFNCIV